MKLRQEDNQRVNTHMTAAMGDADELSKSCGPMIAMISDICSSLPSVWSYCYANTNNKNFMLIYYT